MGKLKRWFLEQVLGREARKASKGKHGPAVQRWYWKLAGKKRLIGYLLGSVACVLMLTPGVPEIYGQVVGGLGFVAVAVGFADKEWRSPKKQAPEAFAGVAAHSASIGTVLIIAEFALRQAGESLWAQVGLDYIEVVVGVLGYMGLATFARVRPGPR